MRFGEKLQALRKARGWSQEELARQINVSRQALSKWESGAAVPDTENVVALSRLFGVTTDYLLLEEGTVTAPSTASVAAPTEENKWPVPASYGWWCLLSPCWEKSPCESGRPPCLLQFCTMGSTGSEN